MPIAKITGQGLCAIGLSVALLWGCLLGERLMLRRAATERVRVLREIKQLRRQPRTIPVRLPMPAASRRLMVAEC